jgi:hypothetical protein
MTSMHPLLYWTTTLLLACITCTVKAQSAAPVWGVHVSGLTAEERDALNLDLQASGGARLVYACVPAGILVLEDADATRSAAETRAVLMSRIAAVVPQGRITEEGLTQRTAEERCSNARNQ